MEVIKMQTNNFWEGEVGVRGLVEDQAQTYNVSLYVKGGRDVYKRQPLSMGLACGQIVLTVAVLSILITAPLGSFLIERTYKKLLKPQ